MDPFTILALVAGVAIVAVTSCGGDRNRRQHHIRGPLFRSNSGMFPGAILIAVGALFFLNNLHIVYLREWFRFWPAILIAAGLFYLIDSTYASGRRLGAILTGAGVIFMARSLNYINFATYELWPLVLVGLGILMLGQTKGEWHVKFPDPESTEQSSTNRLKVDTVFGGAKRVVTTADFQGGEVVSVFGGVELDLRQSGMIADSAILEINAIFGGVELKIPRNWNATVQGAGIFGGYVDNAVSPDPNMPGVKQLIVKGAAIFGGVEVKN